MARPSILTGFAVATASREEALAREGLLLAGASHILLSSEASTSHYLESLATMSAN
jgi:hypothetical protein